MNMPEIPEHAKMPVFHASNTQSEPEEKELVTRKPVTIYAIVQRRKPDPRFALMQDDGVWASYVIVRSETGPQMFDDEERENTYEGCDYGELSGLVTFAGEIVAKTPAWDDLTEDEQDEIADSEDVDFGGYDSVYVGKWRPMTAIEAVSLGLLAEVKLASIPSQISEAVKAEREACEWIATKHMVTCEKDTPPQWIAGDIAAAIRARGES